MHGLATIRALGCEDHFRCLFEHAVNTNAAAYFWFLGSSRWFAVRLETLNVGFLAITLFGSLAVITVSPGFISAGMLGLSATFALQLASVWQWVVRQSAEVENQMVSVERVVAYGALEPEAALSIPEALPGPGWPAQGELHLQELVVRYRPGLPIVLKRVNMHIPARSRVAIVGRTGAGKSTILHALLRLVEPEGGRVTLDGVDLATLGLHEVRRAIAAIPQVPILFAGSLRANLDPFDHSSDSEVWEALGQAQMRGIVSAWPEGLLQPLSSGGQNLSTGEKQLLCLARAILTRSKA